MDLRYEMDPGRVGGWGRSTQYSEAWETVMLGHPVLHTEKHELELFPFIPHTNIIQMDGRLPISQLQAFREYPMSSL